MQTFKLALPLALPLLAASAPTNNGPVYYTLTGTAVQSNNSHIASLINQQEMLPYYESFWFGLPQDNWCNAPQPGQGTNFSCNPQTYQPLYTIDEELELVSKAFNI